MARLKTIRAFAEWVKDEANIAELFRLIVDERLRLRDAAVKLGKPYTLVYGFLHDGGAMQKRYEAALAALADDLMHERLQIADEVKGSDNAVAVAAAKLRCEVREGNAAKWGKERYGEAFEGSKGPAVVIQVADLRGARLAPPDRRALISSVPACPKCLSTAEVTYADMNEYSCRCGHSWIESFPSDAVASAEAVG